MQWNRLAECAHNLSSAHVAGFKATYVKNEEFKHHGRHGHVSSSVTSGQLVRNMTDGAFRYTDRPLDISLSGKGFLAVETPQGIRYTRCGQLDINDQNELVTFTDHYPVLNKSLSPIQLPDRIMKNINFTREGDVIYNKTTNGIHESYVIGKLGLFEFDDHHYLASEGQHCLIAEDEAITSQNTIVTQYGLEQSNVSSVEESVKLVKILRSYEQSEKLFKTFEDMRKKQLNSSSKNI
jgi:flagellar basal body rod protein FlgG